MFHRNVSILVLGGEGGGSTGKKSKLSILTKSKCLVSIMFNVSRVSCDVNLYMMLKCKIETILGYV